MFKFISLLLTLFIVVFISCTDDGFTPTTYDNEGLPDTTYSWVRMETNTTHDLEGLAAEGSLFAIVAGEYNTILRTIDGCESWEELETDLSLHYCGAYFYNYDRIYIYGEDCCFSSSTRGDSWGRFAPSTGGVFRDLCVDSGGTGVAVGLLGLIHSSANQWKSVSSGTNMSLYGVTPGSIHGAFYAVGASGTVLLSADHGLSWSKINIGVENYLMDIQIMPSTNAYVVGGQGTIVAYSTSSWHVLESGTENTLNGLCFIDNNIGLVVGANGTILYTENGGVSWESENSGTHCNLNSVHLLPSGFAIAVGDSGTVLKRTRVIE